MATYDPSGIDALGTPRGRMMALEKWEGDHARAHPRPPPEDKDTFAHTETLAHTGYARARRTRSRNAVMLSCRYAHGRRPGYNPNWTLTPKLCPEYGVQKYERANRHSDRAPQT